VTILDDLEYMELCQSADGQRAFALFCALLAAAKNLNNGGKFSGPLPVLAMTVRWNQVDFKFALEKLLEMGGRWVVGTTQDFTLRNFAKWNKGWGGARQGAGKPPKANQDEIKSNQALQLDSVTASASVTASVSKDSPASDKPKRPRKQSFADVWLPEFRKLLSFDLEDRRCCIAINKLKAIAGEKAFASLVRGLGERNWKSESPEHLWAYCSAALKDKQIAPAEKIYEDRIED
jgi:hypothetical protein